MIYLVTNSDKYSFNGYKKAPLEKTIKYLSDFNILQADTETTGLNSIDHKLISIQLGTPDSKHQFVFDLNSIDILRLKNLLESTTLILHNAKFDIKFLQNNGIFPYKIIDTYSIECVLNMGIESSRKSLGFIASKYLDVAIDKTFQKSIAKRGLDDEGIKYAASDVIYLHDLYIEQDKEVAKYELERAVTLENKFSAVLAYIENCGVHLNKDEWNIKCKKDYDSLLEAFKDLDDWYYDNIRSKQDHQLSIFINVGDKVSKNDINWSSPKQVAEVFSDLGIVTYITNSDGTRKTSVDKNVLKPQADKFDIIPLYLKYKKLEKIVGTYGYGFLDHINKKTGRVHTKFTSMMSTGRMSSGGKDVKAKVEYINFQNIPANPETRSCFCAEDGNILIIADYTNQEGYYLADCTSDDIYIDAVTTGDLHCEAAKLLYPELDSLDIVEIKQKHSDKRSNAKPISLGIPYGATGYAISTNLNVSKDRGEEIYNSFLVKFPGFKKYADKAKEQPLKNGYILINDVTKRKSFIENFDIFQRREKKMDKNFWKLYREEKARHTSYYNDELRPIVSKQARWRSAIERSGMNYPIQGTASDMTKTALILLYEWIAKNNYFFIVKIILVVHDEIVLECPKEISDICAKKLEECMVRAGDIFCKTVKMKASPEISHVWKK